MILKSQAHPLLLRAQPEGSSASTTSKFPSTTLEDFLFLPAYVLLPTSLSNFYSQSPSINPQLSQLSKTPRSIYQYTTHNVENHDVASPHILAPYSPGPTHCIHSIQRHFNGRALPTIATHTTPKPAGNPQRGKPITCRQAT
jgi:hypothetical protein